MESLALMASIIVLSSFLGGPISLILTLYKLEKSSIIRRVVAIIFAVIAIIVGVYLISLDIGIGAKYMGAVGIFCGVASIYRIAKIKTTKR